jgi:hypothetical protein
MALLHLLSDGDNFNIETMPKRQIVAGRGS